MKTPLFCFLLLYCIAATAQDWLTAGNTLGSNGTFGSIDNKKITFITHNKKRGTLTNDKGLWGFGTIAPVAETHINSADSTINPLQIDVQDSQKMVLTGTGNVGIGITTPLAKLHIGGGKNITLSDGGTIIVGPTTSRNLAIDNTEIQTRNNATADALSLNLNGGNVNIGAGGIFFQSATRRVGVGTNAPQAPLHVDGGTHLFKLTDLGYFVTASTKSNNLVLDDGQIQARTNGAKATLRLNPFGGDVNILPLGVHINGSNSFVGIGTTAPEAKLNVIGGTNATLTGGGYILAGPTTFQNMVIDVQEIQARNNGSAAELFLNGDGGTVATGGDLTVGGSNINMQDGTKFGGIELINNFVTGSVGDFVAGSDNADLLGNSSHRWLEVWSVDGSINTSDVRDKTNIRDLGHGLKKIMQLRPVKFNWKNAYNQQDKFGLIAQDLQKVLPEVVKDHEFKKDATGVREKVPATRLGIMYADIIPVLIKGMQEQQRTIEEQNKKIDQLTQLVIKLAAGSLITENQSAGKKQ